MLSNPYNQYRATAVETARPIDLVIMLYKGLVRFTQRGIHAIERRDTAEAHASFIRSQDIVAELVSGISLERGGDIAPRLVSIYDYIFRRLVDANTQKSIAPAAEVLKLTNELLLAWTAIAEGRGGAETATLAVGSIGASVS